MFTLKIPCKIPMSHKSAHGMEEKAGYATLEGAIIAAIQADLDLSAAMIENNGVLHSVNEWISFRIAGGNIGIS